MKECPACRGCFTDHINYCPNDGDATVNSIAGEPMIDGRYLLERRLGRGGMGIVFQAHHIFLKTAHAIKVILPDLVGNDPTLVMRFRQEALAAAAIRHQNIITVTDFGVAHGTMPFLIMEFIKGRSLHDILITEGPFTPAKSLEIISAVGSGIAAAHRQNIVHRDIKPLNIMIHDDLPISQGVKVLDFGLAKIKSAELLGSLVPSKIGGQVGSPFYMAPEQWGDEEPDARADIYSLGVILYQMLGGDVPFKGASLPSIMKKHLMEAPPTLSSMGVNVPPAIEAVVRRALEKDADKRPQTVQEFINELRESVVNTSAPFIYSHLRTDTKPPASTHITEAQRQGTQTPAAEEKGHQKEDARVQQELREQERLETEERDDHTLAEQATRLLPARQAQEERKQAETGLRLQIKEEERGELEEREGAADAELAPPERGLKEREGQTGRTAATSYAPGVDATQPQRHGVVTQQLGENSLVDAAMTNSWQQQPAQFGSHQSVTPGLAPTAPKKSVSSMLMVAALLVAATGAGIGAYFMVVSKTPPTDQPIIKSDSNTGRGGPNNSEPKSTKAEMVAITGGTFQLGRNDGPAQEAPAHSVTVRDFSMDRTEVTNAEYADFINETNYTPPSHWHKRNVPSGQERWPVNSVSLNDAKAFAAWRSKRDQVTYRLPTEEEWEYAARNGDMANLYPWGNSWATDSAVVKMASPKAVGSFPHGKNRWGVVDLIGNVWEWTSSKASIYPGGKARISDQDKDAYVVRGGSYLSEPSGEGAITSTFRNGVVASTRHQTLGFRLVRDGK
jgi:serine/threonine-protein kinase